MKNKKNRLIILIIFLSLLVLGFGGYIVYDKLISKNDNQNLNNSIPDDNIISQLNNKIESYYDFIIDNYSNYNNFFKKANGNYYFNDEFILIQAITSLWMNDWGNTFDDTSATKYKPNDKGGLRQVYIPFSDVDNYIKSNFNITTYTKQIKEWVMVAVNYEFDEKNNQYIIEIIPTGGFASPLKTYNLIIKNHKQINDNYIVYVNFISIIQNGQEYFCAWEEEENLPVKIYNDLEFNNPVIDKTIKVPCNNNSYSEKEIKTLLDYDNILKNAPVYKFIYTKELKLDRIEKE